MHQRVTDIKIMPAPINAHMPGISPSKTATQTGFNSGSTTPISEQARGEQFPLAFATKIYGIPSWKMPKSTKNSHPVLLGAKGRKNVNGRAIRTGAGKGARSISSAAAPNASTPERAFSPA